MAGERILQAVTVGAVFGVDGSFDNDARRRFGRSVGNLQVHVAIEIDQARILQEGIGNVVKGQFPPASGSGVDWIRTQRPTQNLCDRDVCRCSVRQGHVLLGVAKVLSC